MKLVLVIAVFVVGALAKPQFEIRERGHILRNPADSELIPQLFREKGTLNPWGKSQGKYEDGRPNLDQYEEDKMELVARAMEEDTKVGVSDSNSSCRKRRAPKMTGMPEMPKGVPSPTDSMPSPPSAPEGMPSLPTSPEGMPSLPSFPEGMPSPPEGMPSPPEGMPSPPTLPEGMPTPPTSLEGMPPPPTPSEGMLTIPEGIPKPPYSG